MGFRVGSGGGRRPYLTPDNSNMANRANTRLEHLAAASNERTRNALRVDGVQVFVWNRVKGARLCSCSENYSANGDVGFGDNITTNVGDYRVVGNASRTKPLGQPNEAFAFKLPDEDEWATGNAENLSSTTRNSASSTISDIDEEFDLEAELTAQEEALNGKGQVANASSFSDSFLNGNSTKCPVCAGASYVDAWKPPHGQRNVFAFLNDDSYTTNGWVDLNSRPNLLALEKGQTVTWEMKLPKYFSHVMRATWWQRGEPVLNERVTLPDLGNVPLSEAALLSLSGRSPATPVKFSLTASRPLSLSHFECVTALTELPYVQLPPLNTPYSGEYLDFSTTLSMEAGADITVYPGDMLCDLKFNRLWRVTSSTPKQTGEGRTLVQTLDCRAVQVQEPFFSLNVFDNTKDYGAKMYRRRNEKFQYTR